MEIESFAFFPKYGQGRRTWLVDLLLQEEDERNKIIDTFSSFCRFLFSRLIYGLAYNNFLT